MNAAAPGWQPDPTKRHEYRYWDGSQWTDDVSDGGVTSVDPLAGGAGGAGGFPSGESAPYGQGGAGMPPGVSGQQPYGGAPGGSPYAAGYSGGQYPPDQPVKKGPSPALLIAIAVIVVVAIGGVAFALTQGDDDGGTAGSSTTETTAAGDTPTSGGDTTAGGGSTETSAGGSDVIVDAMAEAMASSGQMSSEQARCVAQGMLDEFGLERITELGLSQQQSGTQDPTELFSAEEQEAIFNLMADCVGA